MNKKSETDDAGLLIRPRVIVEKKGNSISKIVFAIFVFVLIIALTAVIYLAAFSPSFYDFVMSFCEVCNGK